MEDARRIMALARPGARVLQMGAGFIGCIILEALASRGVKLTVVEMGDRMVPRMMGEGAGAMIKRWVEKKGIAVHTSTRVQSIRAGSGGAPLEVELSDGKRMPVDLVISSTGVQPNVGFLENSGIACDRGVITDVQMRTNVPGIYAAGDCAEAFDSASGKPVVSAIQPNAADQASCAALNMAGKEARIGAVTQINILDTMGLISTSFGRWQGVPGGDHVERSDQEGFRYLRLEFDGDVLVGANAIGLTEQVGMIRGLIQARVALGEWKGRLLRDPTLLAEAYIARTQAQDRWLRRVA
jgi:NAD(P)H-nitrite reductase large subunit